MRCLNQKINKMTFQSNIPKWENSLRSSNFIWSDNTQPKPTKCAWQHIRPCHYHSCPSFRLPFSHYFRGFRSSLQYSNQWPALNGPTQPSLSNYIDYSLTSTIPVCTLDPRDITIQPHQRQFEFQALCSLWNIIPLSTDQFYNCTAPPEQSINFPWCRF